MAKRRSVRTSQIAVEPHFQLTRACTIVALDPSVRHKNNDVLMAQIQIPYEQLEDGPRGYRVQVIDYDATTRTLYAPETQSNGKPFSSRKNIEQDRAFHARNAYAIVMYVLARFERALGRRVGWSFPGHQLILAPHAFVDLNAFYSKEDRGIYFGYYPQKDKHVFTCLSHEVVAHETTHALVDGLRPRYLYPSSPDQAAFHEGFADIVALLSVLSIDSVVSKALDLDSPSDDKLIAATKLTRTYLRKSVLLGLAQEVGEAMYGTHGVALRRSIQIKPNQDLIHTDEFIEPHRRGELIVAAILGVFLDLWQERIANLGTLKSGMVSRVEVVAAANTIAEHILTIAIRALDYCPPTDLLFGDFLSALLTSDFEMYPDGGQYNYRQAFREGFAAFGIKPTAKTDQPTPEPGLWSSPKPKTIIYNRTHQESMKSDPDEMFRFIWENRKALKLDEEAYTEVESVRPCYRIAPDGFFLRETLAVYTQQISCLAGELRSLRIRKPDGMPDDYPIRLFGGGCLVFDEAGRLKYQIRNRINSSSNQSERLKYLWESGGFSAKRSFAAIHLERTLRVNMTSASATHSDHGEEEEHED